MSTSEVEAARAQIERQLAEHASRYVDRTLASAFFGTTAEVVERAPTLTLTGLIRDSLRALTGFDWHVSDFVPAAQEFMRVETPLVNGGRPLWIANTKRAEELLNELLKRSRAAQPAERTAEEMRREVEG